MNQKIRTISLLSLSGFFLLFDQILKYFARLNPDFTYYLWKPRLGWEYYTNTGIAFSLPFPNTILIIITPLIILGLIIFLLNKKTKTNLFCLGTYLILAGAISNLMDRLLFSATIDYLRLITSVINLADILVVGGAALLILNEYKNKKISA